MRNDYRQTDRRAFSEARKDFIGIVLSMILSWAVFGLLLYAAWEAFLWLNERISHWPG